MSADTVQVRSAPPPLVCAEAPAPYLADGVRTGLVVCADQGLTVRRPGSHTLVGADLVVRTPLGTEADRALEAALPVTDRAESLDERSLKGWYVPGTVTAVPFTAPFTTPAAPVTDPHERSHYRRTLPAPADRPSSTQK